MHSEVTSILHLSKGEIMPWTFISFFIKNYITIQP